MPAKPRVLIVEDEPLIAMMLRDWVTDLGCDPIGPAHTVSTALGFIERECPDTAILDISLGSQDCYPIADALSERHVPFAFASGCAGTDIPRRHACAMVVVKPFVFDQVRDAVSKALNGSSRPQN